MVGAAELAIAADLARAGDQSWPELEAILCNFWCRAPDIGGETIKHYRSEKVLEASTRIEEADFLARTNESRCNTMFFRALTLAAQGFRKVGRPGDGIESIRDKHFHGPGENIDSFFRCANSCGIRMFSRYHHGFHNTIATPNRRSVMQYRHVLVCFALFASMAAHATDDDIFNNGFEILGCGGTSVLAYDFTGADPGEIWAASSGGGASLAEVGGELVVTLPNGSLASSDASYSTNRFYDLHSNSVSVKVTSVGNTATTAAAYFAIDDGSGDRLEFREQLGTLKFTKTIGGTTTTLKTMVYSPASHLYWRLREDGTNTYWETSSDGTSWVIQAQAVTSLLFPVDYILIDMGGSTDGGEVNPGTVHFAQVNGGGTPSSKWCPMSTITDDFSTSTPSPAWKRSYVNSPMTVTQTGGQLMFTLAANLVVFSAYYSSASYDLTGSSFVVQVPQTANVATTAQTYIALNGQGANDIEMLEENGQLTARISVGGTDQNLASAAYDPTQHAWWRIRESGGTLFWDTSPDGKTWTVLCSDSTPFAIDVLDVVLAAGTWQSQANPGTSNFDNVNLTPP
jgi:hypothetical protein